MSIDLFLLLLLVSGAAVVALAVIGPPLQLLFDFVAERLDDLTSDYYSHWLSRRSVAGWNRQQRQTRERFEQWFASRFDAGMSSGVSEEELVAAAQLMPIIRQLLEEEVPGAIRRCNHLHRRLALLTHASHMREIAGEPEALGTRSLASLLLERTLSLLDQYPLAMRLDSEELLDATLVLRRNLAPTCKNCPYVRKTVAEAGEHCPAAKLIGLEQRPC